MKPTLSVPAPQTKTTPERRRQLLEAFEGSGLSAAAFARQHGIVYSTFSAWRRRRPTQPKVCFAEVELVKPSFPEAIVVEVGRARMRLSSPEQIELAAALLHRLEGAC